MSSKPTKTAGSLPSGQRRLSFHSEPGSKRQKFSTAGSAGALKQHRDGSGSSFAPCPVCSKQVLLLCINLHLDECCGSGGLAGATTTAGPLCDTTSSAVSVVHLDLDQAPAQEHAPRSAGCAREPSGQPLLLPPASAHGDAIGRRKGFGQRPAPRSAQLAEQQQPSPQGEPQQRKQDASGSPRCPPATSRGAATSAQHAREQSAPGPPVAAPPPAPPLPPAPGLAASGSGDEEEEEEEDVVSVVEVPAQAPPSGRPPAAPSDPLFRLSTDPWLHLALSTSADPGLPQQHAGARQRSEPDPEPKPAPGAAAAGRIAEGPQPAVQPTAVAVAAATAALASTRSDAARSDVLSPTGGWTDSPGEVRRGAVRAETRAAAGAPAAAGGGGAASLVWPPVVPTAGDGGASACRESGGGSARAHAQQQQQQEQQQQPKAPGVLHPWFLPRGAPRSGQVGERLQIGGPVRPAGAAGAVGWPPDSAASGGVYERIAAGKCTAGSGSAGGGRAAAARVAAPPPDASVATATVSGDCDEGAGAGGETGLTRPDLTPRILQPVLNPSLEGQYLVPEFVSLAEEAELLALCDDPGRKPVWSPWAGQTYGNATAQKTRGKRWGVLPDYHRRGVAPLEHPLPPLLRLLVERMRSRVGLGLLRSFSPNEANAIDYRLSKGSWLRPHVDDRILSGDLIVNLSLAGAAVMTFGREKGKERERGGERAADEVRVLLPPRSLQVLSRAARYSYTHAIAPADLLSERRVSITFRRSELRAFEKPG